MLNDGIKKKNLSHPPFIQSILYVNENIPAFPIRKSLNVALTDGLLANLLCNPFLMTTITTKNLPQTKIQVNV